MLSPYKKGLPLPFSLSKKRIYVDTDLKATLVFPIPTGRVGREWLVSC